MSVGTVTSKGQVTIPKVIRDRVGIEAGTRLHFKLAKNGSMSVEVGSPDEAPSLFGSLREFAPHQPVSVADMTSAIRRRVAERQARAAGMR